MAVFVAGYFCFVSCAQQKTHLSLAQAGPLAIYAQTVGES
jgi:hypothetical protein